MGSITLNVLVMSSALLSVYRYIVNVGICTVTSLR